MAPGDGASACGEKSKSGAVSAPSWSRSRRAKSASPAGKFLARDPSVAVAVKALAGRLPVEAGLRHGAVRNQPKFGPIGSPRGCRSACRPTRGDRARIRAGPRPPPPLPADGPRTAWPVVSWAHRPPRGHAGDAGQEDQQDPFPSDAVIIWSRNLLKDSGGQERCRFDPVLLTWSFAVGRWSRGHRCEDVVALQGDLEGVGDPGHVMAAARPPEDVEGAFRPEVIDQPLHVLGRDRPGLLGLFPGEQERGPIAGRERRPVPAGQPPCPFIECRLVEARDREQHFAVAHSVEAMDRAGHDPEQALLEDPVLLRLLAEGAVQADQAAASSG